MGQVKAGEGEESDLLDWVEGQLFLAFDNWHPQKQLETQLIGQRIGIVEKLLVLAH